MGKEIQASLKIDPQSLRKFNAALGQLREAAREQVVKEALLEGGGVIQDAAQSRASGPYIEAEFLKGSQLNKGSATGMEKKYIKSNGLYVVVGPDKAHWYYRFSEFGTVAHTVKKRKQTRFMQFSRKQGVKRKDMRSTASGKSRAVGKMKPVMSWMQGGKRVFAHKVAGMAAKPFLRPAVDQNENETMQAIGKVIAREIKKADNG